MMNEALNCLETRRSCRAFAPRQVEEEALQAILRAGSFAANGRGNQPCRVVVVQDAETVAKLQAMNAAVIGNPDMRPFYDAPTVLIVFADAAASPNTYVEDGSLVMGNLMNAAHAVGVGSCWVHRARQMFQSPEGKALMRQWGIEDSYVGIANCILGYPAREFPQPKPRRADFVVRAE